jgi:hypothetical protein
MSPAILQGQEKIDLKGVVVDETTGAAVSGAYILVVDKGATSDAEGRFHVRGLAAGTHALVVTHLGYATSVQVAEVEPGGEPLRIQLEPNPVIMQAIEVVVNRMKARRNALAVSVRAYETRDMLSTSDAYDFLRSRLTMGRCPSFNTQHDCVFRRGRWVAPQIYIDEVPYTFSGVDVLRSYPTSEIHTIEVLNSGGHIRVYTKWFARRLAMGQAWLSPIIVF